MIISVETFVTNGFTCFLSNKYNIRVDYPCNLAQTVLFTKWTVSKLSKPSSDLRSATSFILKLAKIAMRGKLKRLLGFVLLRHLRKSDMIYTLVVLD